MSDEIKKVSVRIGGMSYQLVTAENDLYTRQIAAKADEMIRRVLQNSPQLSMNMCTVLALVNAVDEITGLYQKLSSVDGQKNETEKQAGEARKELMRLREQNWEMKKELLRLNDLCKEYQALINKLTTPEIADAQVPADEIGGETVSGATAKPAEAEPAEPTDEAGSETITVPLAAAVPTAAPAPAATETDIATEAATANTAAIPAPAADTAAGDRSGDPLPAGPSLRQTDLDEYLRANGWPQTFENRKS